MEKPSPGEAHRQTAEEDRPYGELDPSRGHEARAPRYLPLTGWKEALIRVWRAIGTHNLSLVAAGVAFFSLLSLFPAFSAFVAVYGLFASPAEIIGHLQLLEGLLPPDALNILRGALTKLASSSDHSLNLALLLSIFLGLWGASRGTGALISACNVAYNEMFPRNVFVFKALALLFAAGGIGVLLVTALLVFAVPVVLGLIPGGGVLIRLIDVLRWPITAAGMILALQALYRYAPYRRRARWRWVSWGSVFAAVAALVASAVFSLLVQRIGALDEIYGAIAGVAALLLWLYMGAYVVVLGAELNAALEHQTAIDTTIGADRPLGERGAFVADHVPE